MDGYYQEALHGMASDRGLFNRTIRRDVTISVPLDDHCSSLSDVISEARRLGLPFPELAFVACPGNAFELAHYAFTFIRPETDAEMTERCDREQLADEHYMTLERDARRGNYERLKLEFRDVA